jgi:hypothetical protein
LGIGVACARHLLTGASDNSTIAWDVARWRDESGPGTAPADLAPLGAHSAARAGPKAKLAPLEVEQDGALDTKPQPVLMQHSAAAAAVMAHDGCAGRLWSGCRNGMLMCWQYAGDGARGCEECVA